MEAQEAAEAALAASLQEAGYLAPDDGNVSENEPEDDVDEGHEVEALAKAGANVYKKPTLDLIDRLIQRLRRTRRRETEADPGHLLEAVTVIVYDPDKGELHPTLPPAGSKLRWDEFVGILAEAYDIRFED